MCNLICSCSPEKKKSTRTCRQDAIEHDFHSRFNLIFFVCSTLIENVGKGELEKLAKMKRVRDFFALLIHFFTRFCVSWLSGVKFLIIKLIMSTVFFYKKSRATRSAHREQIVNCDISSQVKISYNFHQLVYLNSTVSVPADSHCSKKYTMKNSNSFTSFGVFGIHIVRYRAPLSQQQQIEEMKSAWPSKNKIVRSPSESFPCVWILFDFQN